MNYSGLSYPNLAVVRDAIIRQEGASGSLNNPGNLMYAGQPGAVPQPVYSKGKLVGVFAKFETWAAGMAALERQIALDARSGLTIAQFTAKYAPAGHGNNDPGLYARNIAAAAGVSTAASLLDVISGGSSMAGGVPLYPAVVPAPALPSQTAGFGAETGLPGVEDGLDPFILAGLAAIVLAASWSQSG